MLVVVVCRMLHGWMEQGVNAVFMLFPAAAVSTHQPLTPLCLPSLLLPHHAFFCHLENTLKLGQRRSGYESVGMTHSIKIVGHYNYCSQHLSLSVSALQLKARQRNWKWNTIFGSGLASIDPYCENYREILSTPLTFSKQTSDTPGSVTVITKLTTRCNE